MRDIYPPEVLRNLHEKPFRVRSGILQSSGRWSNGVQHAAEAFPDRQSCEIANVGEKFAEVRVPVSEEDAVDDWRYHPWLGVFRNM